VNNIYRTVFERAPDRGFAVPYHVTSRALVPVLRTLPADKVNITFDDTLT